MKIEKIFCVLVTAILISSCATTTFYQVYNVKPVNESITNVEDLFFEDDNCKISYNLWENGGNIGFNFYNKTDKNVYVRLNESSFILNGFAYDYFKNRTFTTSESNSATASNTAVGSVAVTGVNIYNNVQTNQVKSSTAAIFGSSVGYAVSIKEDSIISIPPKTTKRISEYSINNALIRNCDLLKYPKRKEIVTKSYTAEISPIVFSNRITYEIDGDSKLIENKFFVSDITNYPETEFLESRDDEYCGQRVLFDTEFYKFYNIDKFYIKYNKGTDYWKH
jgi:hypothetical protein